MKIKNGYIKMLALYLSDWETKIIDERHTNCTDDMNIFKEKYANHDCIKVIFIYMESDCTLEISDYYKIIPDMHPGDYIRNLINFKHGQIIDESDINDIKSDSIENIENYSA